MGKGLSPLQRDILAALEAQPPGWVPAKEIFEALDLERTPSNRAAVSKALRRLCDRKLIEWGQGEVMSPGKGYLYRRKAR